MSQRFYVLGLLITAVFSFWLVWHFVFNLSFAPPSNPNYPDAFVKNLLITVMNEQGQREYQFSSPSMVHYAQNDRTDFTQPLLYIYEAGQSPWVVRANQGEALNGNTTVNLSGNVTMFQAASATGPSTTIKTTKATIYPKVRVVTTDQYISAVQPAAELDGVGMRLDMVQQTLDLLSQVHGYYVQPAKR